VELERRIHEHGGIVVLGKSGRIKSTSARKAGLR
jgi:hypothetical protein